MRKFLRTLSVPFAGMLIFTLTAATNAGAQTVSTDKDDYHPGEYVTITGSGWSSGETVTLHLDETPTLCPNGHNLYAVADGNGDIVNNQFLIETKHIGVTFVLTATGQTSGLTAQTTFTDAGLNFFGSDNAQHGTIGSEENLGSVTQGTSINLTCPRGTGLTVAATGGPILFPVDWNVAYGGAGANNATLSPLTTLSPGSGSITSSGGSGGKCVAMTITTGSLTVGTTYHGSLVMTGVDNQGATTTATYFFRFTVISACTVPILSETHVNVACKGGATGGIDLTTTGGSSPFTYAWTRTGGGFSASTQDISGLTAGTYNVTVTATGGCTTSTSVTITEPATAVSVALTSKTDVLCYGASTGAINITASGGIGPYTYAWTGTGVNATAEDQTGLAAGNYSVIVTDANGCSTASLPVAITQPATPVSVSLTSQTNVLCYGASTGAINITASGGTGPYTYAWTGTGVNATAEDQTGLAAGNYSVIVTDANGCSTASLPVTITQPATPVSVSLTSQTNVLCYGASTGAINITASGGVGPYTYVWTGTGVNATAEDQTGLAAGNYSVIVTDANGCSTASLPVTITQPATAVSVALTSKTDVLCFGASTGAINITASGGTPPYTYAWTGTGVNATAEDQTGLAAGNYSVIVTDANGCSTASLPVTITQPATAVSVSLTSRTNVLCYGASTGAINITASGGTPPYTYAWTGTGVNATAEDQTGLAAGNYSVIVMDANGCSTASLPVTITQPATAVSVALTSKTDVLCFGASTGAINITASGGVGPYTYAWTGTGVNATAEDQAGLAAGNYSVIVTDANGCSTASLPVAITQPATPVSVSLTSQTNVLCYGASTGAINITASGGVGPYTYVWTGTGVNATAEDQTGLAAGNYSVIVTDANGCSTASLPVTITQPATAVVAVCSDDNPVLYFGYDKDQTTTITVAVSGGTGPYTISFTMDRPKKCNVINDAGDEVWQGLFGTTTPNTCPVFPNPGTITPVTSASGLSAGSYSVKVTLLADAVITATVTDANGCTTSCSRTISAEDVRCFAGNSNVQKVTLCHKTGSAKNPLLPYV
jgi:hypothetical protein